MHVFIFIKLYIEIDSIKLKNIIIEGKPFFGMF